MELIVQQVALYLALTIESVALTVISVGLIVALVRSVLLRLRTGDWFGSYEDIRKAIGRTLLLGLELLLAAEIVRSIMAGETLMAAATLGVVVVVRTFLSITIEMEINGRWPWNMPDGVSHSGHKTPGE
jgi:uncharacterized membrane protein